jgi:hypothetical protein
MAGHFYNVDVRRAASDEVWFRYHQLEDGEPEIEITDLSLLTPIKTINGLGSRPAGTYASRSRAIFWDTKDTGGTPQGGAIFKAILVIDSVQYDVISFVLP